MTAISSVGFSLSQNNASSTVSAAHKFVWLRSGHRVTLIKLGVIEQVQLVWMGYWFIERRSTSRTRKVSSFWSALTLPFSPVRPAATDFPSCILALSDYFSWGSTSCDAGLSLSFGVVLRTITTSSFSETLLRMVVSEVTEQSFFVSSVTKKLLRACLLGRWRWTSGPSSSGNRTVWKTRTHRPKRHFQWAPVWVDPLSSGDSLVFKNSFYMVFVPICNIPHTKFTDCKDSALKRYCAHSHHPAPFRHCVPFICSGNYLGTGNSGIADGATKNPKCGDQYSVGLGEGLNIYCNPPMYGKYV